MSPMLVFRLRRLRHSRRLAASLLLLLVLVVAGCSIRKLAYNIGARFLVDRIADTFDLDKSQKQQVKARIAGIHDWHRKQELPRYVQTLDALIVKFSDGMTREEVIWAMGEAEAAANRLADRSAPEAGAMLDLLTPQQISHSESEMRKSTKERFERLEQPEEEYVKFRLSRAKKNLKSWTGSYTDGQLAEFERFIRKNRGEELRRRGKTERNQQALLDALRRRVGPGALTAMVHSWITRQEIEPTADYQAAEKRNQEDFIDFAVALDKQLTDAQRRRVLEELRSLRTDLYELSTGN